MDHVCKSALTTELREKSNGRVADGASGRDDEEIRPVSADRDSPCLCACLAALLQERWEALAVKLSQTQQQIRACETAMVFAFVEVKPSNASLRGAPPSKPAVR